LHHNAKPHKSLDWEVPAELFLPQARLTSTLTGQPSSVQMHLKLECIIAGNESFPAKVTLEIPSLQLSVNFDGDIKLE
jgi:hypothetical protein